MVFRVQGLGFGGFPKLGVPFWGPNNKDYSTLVSILVSPFLGELPFWATGRTVGTDKWGFGV